MKNKRLVLIVVLTVLVVVALVLIFGRKDFNKKREEQLVNDMEKYYVRYLKDKVIGINKHQVSLEMLEKTGYDMELYTKCDLKESYSIIEVKEDNVTVQNHLICN